MTSDGRREAMAARVVPERAPGTEPQSEPDEHREEPAQDGGETMEGDEAAEAVEPDMYDEEVEF